MAKYVLPGSTPGMPVTAPPGSGARRLALLVGIGLVVLAATAPLLFLRNVAKDQGGDPAYRALVAYARAHNGESSFDAKAAEAYPTLIRTELGGGRERFARRSPDGSVCWVLDIEPGEPAQKPRRGVKTDCDEPATTPAG